LNSSIVANNTSYATPPNGTQIGPDLNGGMSSGDYNLIKNTNGATLTGTHNITGQDPLLGPLADNGGPTQTMALQPGSPAIDQGKDATGTDQRGFTRPVDVPNIPNAAGGDGSDIGAFEFSPGGSAAFVVTTTADHDDGSCDANDCTLREAINAANSAGGSSLISFKLGVTGTLTLTSALPTLASNMSIQGPGASVITVARSGAGGTPNFSLFTINNTNSSITVTIANLTLSNGKSSTNGGAINQLNGTLTVNNSILTNNTAGTNGGAIADGLGTLTVNNSVLSNNTAGISGGGIYNGTTTTVNNSTLSNNTVNSGGFGGGLFSQSGTLTVNDSTLASNNSDNGAGIYIAGGTANVNNSTIASNTAKFDGGGIERFSGTLNLNSSIVANNSALTGTGPDLLGTVASGDYNLIRNTSGATLTGTHNITGQDPLLDPAGLKNNGGPTPTIALQSGSPAVDQGKDAAGTGKDQRGLTRPVDIIAVSNAAGGDGSDIGAFELQTSEASSAVYQLGPSFTVTKTADTNDGTCGATDCSLREAINAANSYNNSKANAGATIKFANNVTGTITLTTALPTLNSNINVQGPGANVLTVARSGAGGTSQFGVFTFLSGTSTLSGLTISGGSSDFSGGGILNEDTLTVSNSTVTNNSANNLGGGILNDGTLTLSNSTVTNNSAPNGFGGGVGNTGTFMVSNSTVANNAANNGGGGIDNTGSLTVSNSTVANNSANAFGGGIYSNSTLTVSNSTVTNNAANFGGGIYNFRGTLTVNNSTAVNNAASQSGGGIYNGNILNLSNSIVANNTAPASPDLKGSMNSGDYNLIKNTSGATLTGTHNITGQDPVLGSLADNGGPTPTMALLNGSPAIDAGDPAFDGTGKTDQRGPGFARVVHNRLDIGAFEVQHLANFGLTKTAAPSVLIPGAEITYTISLTNNDTAAAPNTTLIDAVPVNTTFVSATQSSGPTFTLNKPVAGGTGNVTATNSSFAANASATFTILVRVSNNTPDNTTITNTASVSSDYPDIPGTGTATATATSNTALNGTNGDDTLVVTAIGLNSGTYSLNGGPAVPFSSLPQLIFNGGAGNDTLTIKNPAGGLFAPADGITFNGGPQNGAPGDQLQIVGGAETTATYTYTTSDANGHNGNISLDGGGVTATYSYTGLDPISNTGTATNIIFNLPGTSDNIVLQDLGGGNSQLSSPDGTFETTTFANPAAGGSVTINAGGGNDNISITPSLNYPVLVDGGPGLDSLNVDLTGVVNPVFTSTGTNAGTITFGPTGNRQTITYSNVEVVYPTNQPPSNTVPGTQTTLEDAPLTFSVASGNALAISDPDAGSAPVRVTLTVTNGTLTLPATTGLTFNSGGNGTASMVFTGTIANINSDLNGLVFTPALHSRNAGLLTITTNDLGNTGSGGARSATDNVVLNITPVNHAPVANNDSYSTAEDSVLTVAAANGVLANDTDIDGDTLTVGAPRPVSGPAHGNLTLNANGSFTYTPAANYNGPDSFTYQANDGALNSNVATVNLTVTAVNDAPVAVNDSYSTAEDTSLTVNAASGILANDTDIDGDTLTVGAVVNQPTHGTLTLNPNGSFTYTPNADFNGTDSFTYRAFDGLVNSNVATATITVTAVNDAPVNTVPGAQTTLEDTPLSFAAANGNAISVSDVDANGGNEQVTLTVAHGTLTLGSTAGLTVTGNNTASVTLTGTLPNLNAALTGLTYTPALHFHSGDTLGITTNDQGNTGTGGNLTDIKAVAITVVHVNHAPVAVNDVFTTAEDTPLTVSAVTGLLNNDTDIDGDTLTVGAVVNNPTHGTLTVNPDGSFTYTPDANYNGTDSFTYRAYDGTALSNNLATVTLNITAVNDAPVAKNDTYTATEDAPLTINAANGVLANDTDVDSNTLTVGTPRPVSGPSHGTLALNADGSFTYTPGLHYNGPDSFTYKANDGALDSNVATVNLTVTAINYPPVANNDGFTTAEDTPLSISAPGVLANDTDVENSPLTVGSLVTSPSHGTVGLNADGSLSYVPNANFNGTDTFTYRAYDGTALSNNLATVTITVTAVNDAPVNTVPGAQSTPEDTPLVFSTANGNLISIADVDAGVGNEQVTLTVAHGTLTLGSTTGLTVTGNNTASVTLTGTLPNLNAALSGLSYTPALHFHSGDTLSLTTNDQGNTGAGGAKTASSTVTITVTHVNHAPVATDDTYTTAEDTALNATVLTGVVANDTDIDGDVLKASVLNGPTNGTLTLNGDGSFTYTPDADFNGSDSFTYHVFDGTTFSNTATVTLTVTAVNDAPVNSVPGAQSVNQDTPLVFSTANNNALSVSDVDAGTNAVQVTLAATNGTVTLATLNGLTITGGSNGGATVTVSGSLANLNAALNGLRFTPSAGFSGAAALTMTTNDNGNSGAGGAKTTSSTVPITVTAVARTLSINSVSVLEGNSGVTPATFTVTLSAPSTVPASVQFATADGTAKAGSDYLSTSGTLTFAPGETSKTIAVSVVGDTMQEDNETFLVLLSKPTGGATISTNAGVGTILDDDGPPALAINDVSQPEGNSGTTNMTFTVTLTAPSGKPVSVDYATADGTATAGSDYTSTSGTLSFAPGQTSKTINVPIIGDTIVEPNETFLVQLSNAVGAPIVRNQGTGTILNDDQTPPPPPTPVLSVNFNNVNNGDVYRSLPTLVGNVAEALAPANATLNVQVSIQRQSDSKYFTGSSWSASPVFFPATVANGTWTLAAGVLPTNTPNGQFLIDDKYNLTALATDNGGRSASASLTLIIDHTPPTISITTPRDKAVLSSLTAIGGKVADAVGGTGVQKVLLTLVRVSDGKQWNGASFVTPPTIQGKVQAVVFLAQGDVSKGVWVRRSGLPTGNNLTAGEYRLTAIALDGAGNRGEAHSTLTIKSSTPQPTAAASTIALSTAKVSVTASSVQLRFLGALDAESAGDAAHYTVMVNGAVVTVESAGYNSATHSVTLSLPDGSLHAGDKLTVQWHGVSDMQDNVLNGQAGPLVAR